MFNWWIRRRILNFLHGKLFVTPRNLVTKFPYLSPQRLASCLMVLVQRNKISILYKITRPDNKLSNVSFFDPREIPVVLHDYDYSFVTSKSHLIPIFQLPEINYNENN